jgi:mannosyl-3-phosphoglycerate phosphatase
MSSRRWIVVTDLDGTLLDHFTYSMKPADETLSFLDSRDIPVIMCSSKTRVEMETIAHDTGLTQYPFVIENGAAIVSNGEYEQIFGVERSKILKAFSLMQKELNIDARGFSSFTVDELAEMTGLSMEESERALCREFSEPFILLDNEHSDVFTKSQDSSSRTDSHLEYCITI